MHAGVLTRAAAHAETPCGAKAGCSDGTGGDTWRRGRRHTLAYQDPDRPSGGARSRGPAEMVVVGPSSGADHAAIHRRQCRQ
ncbi:hypothetical protein NDU88_007113 [Pleurodeles waltl]|uniref:Uncharacterized protein n=1 Tax=Pleurodeles waltl TaxID=8319 RepID=A0AAV7U1C7_PLEWA|nr:hypothetical protein NDU88_007113 [Pleurodeles waltl]